MLFVTVGTDMPFDRMVRVVDAWAGEAGRRDVFAQIGRTEWKPRFIQYKQFLEPPEFVERFQQSSVIVAHAGMGTILSALRYQKPILVMPRKASLGEQRNDHQLATARRLFDLGKLNVAYEESDLTAWLYRLSDLEVRGKTGAYATGGLVAALKSYIQTGTTS